MPGSKGFFVIQCVRDTSCLQSNMLRFAALMDGVSLFDSAVFRLTRAEAVTMDPQTRILLEQSHAAMQVDLGTKFRI